MKGKKVPPAVKERCRELYFKYATADEIHKATGVSPSLLRNWIYGRSEEEAKTAWSARRAGEAQKIIREAGERNSLQAHRTVKLGFNLVVRSLEALTNRKKRITRTEKTKGGKTRTIVEEVPYPLEVGEAKDVTQIITNIDKLMRLAAGEPTEISENREQRFAPITVQELREAMEMDRFIELVPIKNERKENGRDREFDSEVQEKGLGVGPVGKRDQRGATRGELQDDQEAGESSGGDAGVIGEDRRAARPREEPISEETEGDGSGDPFVD